LLGIIDLDVRRGAGVSVLRQGLIADRYSACARSMQLLIQASYGWDDVAYGQELRRVDWIQQDRNALTQQPFPGEVGVDKPRSLRFPD